MAAKKNNKSKTVKYVCIRRCYDRGRMWKPMAEAVHEKDYLLVVASGEKVDKNNFMKVAAKPEKKETPEEEKVALSDIQDSQKTDSMLE